MASPRHLRPVLDSTETDPFGSGVRRAAPPRAERTGSERPTVPAPKCRVTEEKTDVDEIYARVVGGRAALVLGPPSLPGRSLDLARGRAQAATHDLLLALGSLDRVPVQSCSADELRRAPIDHRQAFILALVDGESTIDAIVDASPMPMHWVLLTLNHLLLHGLIGFGP